MAKKKVGLFFEHIDREYMSLKALADRLTNTYGYHTEIYSSVYQQIEAYKSHKKQPFDLIAVPYIYGLRSLYPYYLLFKNKKKQPQVVNLQYEQIAAPFNFHRLLPEPGDVQRACYYFCWNEEYGAKLVQSGIDPKKNHQSSEFKTYSILRRVQYNWTVHILLRNLA